MRSSQPVHRGPPCDRAQPPATGHPMEPSRRRRSMRWSPATGSCRRRGKYVHIHVHVRSGAVTSWCLRTIRGVHTRNHNPVSRIRVLSSSRQAGYEIPTDVGAGEKLTPLRRLRFDEPGRPTEAAQIVRRDTWWGDAECCFPPSAAGSLPGRPASDAVGWCGTGHGSRGRHGSGDGSASTMASSRTQRRVLVDARHEESWLPGVG